MPKPFDELILYLRLAQAYKNRLQMSDRDRALVLSGTCAHVVEMPAVAEFCRQLILKNNPGHMMRKYDSFAHACDDSDFGYFVKQVRRKLSPEKGESQLLELGYNCDVRRDDYDDEESFVAAVMGVDVEWVRDNFAPE